MVRRVDDLILLTQVVEAGSFTGASAATGLPKSLLSRRIAELEIELGVRLIERTTRSFHVTDVGERLYQHGCVIRDERDAALALVDDLLVHPSGALSIVSPVVLAEQVIGEIAVAFAARYPSVQLTFDVVNGMPNYQPEHYDVTFLPAYGDLPDSEAIARRVMTTPYALVAAPDWIVSAGRPDKVQALNGLAGIGWWQAGSRPIWRLTDGDGDHHEVLIRPSLMTNNLAIARRATLAGLGMARLPEPLCRSDLTNGALVPVLSGVVLEPIVIHVVYPSRRSLTAAGRAFLAMLDEFAPLISSFGAVSPRHDLDISPRRRQRSP